MAGSEGDGTPRQDPSRREEEEQATTPVSARTATGRASLDVSPSPASESSLDRQVDEQSPVTRRDLARTRRAIGTSLKSMHEEFTRLLTTTQQECAARVDSIVQLLTNDRAVTAQMLEIEAKKREALETQLAERITDLLLRPWWNRGGRKPAIPRASRAMSCYQWTIRAIQSFY